MNKFVQVASVLALAACGGGDDDGEGAAPQTSAPTETTAPAAPTTTTVALPTEPPYEVETVELTFTDGSRAAELPDGTVAQPARTLETTIYVPQGQGPFPLIVHAHGSSGHPRKFSQLLTAWANQGYVVAAPAFPLTNDERGGPSINTDYVNQPADLSFVLDNVLALSDGGAGPVGGKVDPEKIGASGLSLGGITTYGLVDNTCCVDERVDAAIVMAGIKAPFEGGAYEARPFPLLALHGDADPAIPYTAGRAAFDQAASPKWFVTLEGGGHAEPFEDTASPHDDVVTRTTTDFWALTLGGDEAAAERLTAAADESPVASVTTAP